MSQNTIQTKIEQIRNETQQYGNTRGRVADLLTMLNTEKLDRDGALALLAEISSIAPEFLEYVKEGHFVIDADAGFGGDLVMADDPDPTKPTWYFAKESGTYPNAGGLVVDLTNKLVVLNYDGTTWSMVEVATLNGKSAYEVAVQKGFVGTETEWLESLKGRIPDYSTLTFPVAAGSLFIKDGVFWRVKDGQVLESADIVLEGVKLENIGGIIKRNSVDDDAIEFIYNDGAPLAKIKKNGDFILRGIGNLQKKIKEIETPSKISHSTNHNLFPSDEINNKFILPLIISGNSLPIPVGLMPQRFSFSKSMAETLKGKADSVVPCVVNSMRENDSVVHPYVLELHKDFFGFRYIMAITGYLVEREENPSLLASNDLINWENISGIESIMAIPNDTSFLSDVGLCFDYRKGELIMYYREQEYNLPNRTIYFRKTNDGKTWTEPSILYSALPSEGNIMSPAIIFNHLDNYFHMYCGINTGQILHKKSKHINGNWEDVQILNIPGAWHYEIKFIGDKFVMVLNNASIGAVYLGISTDCVNWDWCTELYSTASMYKTSIIPDFINDKLFLHFLYTFTPGPGVNCKMFKVTTNSIAI